MDSKEANRKTYQDKTSIKFSSRKELSEEAKQEVSSTYSSMSSSNFTMSCSGVDEQYEKEPSTSGCSSFLGHAQLHQKTKKKERVKEYLKELKSIVQPTKGGHGRMGTLSTLQHVLTSMRKMKEVKQKSKKDKKLLPAPEDVSVLQCDLMHTVYESDSHESLTSESLKSNDELRIVLSTRDHVVKNLSGNLRYVLGYPKDSWIGRSFDDYIHKKDLITFNSFHRNEWDSESCSQDEDEIKTESKIFYFRLRKFKSLGNSGFSLRKQESYIPFQCMFTLRKMTASELTKEGTYSSSWYEETSTSGNSGSLDAMVPEIPSPPEIKQGHKNQHPEKKKLYTILYCVPLVSPYSVDKSILPEVKTFETRHTLFCSYCHVQPNTIPLLGYLPQEMIGVSIFDFYHNDDLKALYNIYRKVITLKDITYRSNPIRFRAKNGSWIICMTEWSSFVNPWTKRLEFIIGKHTVIKGPDNKNVFSDNFHMPTLEETPDVVLQARQKIKDLLLQPVETVYVGSTPENVQVKGKVKSVAIRDQAEEIQKPMSETVNNSAIYQRESEAMKLSTTGLIFKSSSINRAYDQLNYTNCIKKFLLSQPRSFNSDSSKKGSSDDTAVDLNEKASVIEKWLHNFDNVVPPSSIHMTSVDSRSMPALNDDYWKKTIIPDSDFDFDISVPKPPSFGSSTKVLVSEQEHRDNENSLDPMGLREILQVAPSSSHNMETVGPSSPKSTAGSTSGENLKVLTLTRDTLMKHTLLQEQLYLATASPDRSIVFMSESQNPEETSKKQRQSLKRSHSPDQLSSERYKSGRHFEERPSITTASILNPSFPLLPSFEENQPGDTSPCRVPVSVQVFPIVTFCQTAPAYSSVCTTDQSKITTGMTDCNNQRLPYFYTDVNQMMVNPMMVGFQQSPMLHTGIMGNSMPLPVQQLNSYIMQQASVGNSTYGNNQNRKKQDREKNKAQQVQSSTEESSTEDTLSSLYLLESENNVKMTYHELVMQSLAQQMSPQERGLRPAPWLESVCFTDNLQHKYHMPKTKHKRLLKKDREAIDKLIQPDMVCDQLDELLTDLENCKSSLKDEEFDYLFFPLEDVTASCSCADLSACKQCCIDDHGINEALKQFRKSNKKEKQSRKALPQSPSSTASSMTVDMSNVKVEDSPQVDNENNDPEEDKMDIGLESDDYLSRNQTSVNVKSKPGSCSSKSDSGEGDIRSDIDSNNSLNTCSVLTQSDQRSNNENGSSLKESDGDAMSKKSDSSSDKQHVSSESESECKSSYQSDIFSKLFTSLDICFPHSHKNNVPWLVDTNFTNDVEMKYQLVMGDKEETLKRDRKKLASFDEPALVSEQLSALIEDIRESESMDRIQNEGAKSEMPKSTGSGDPSSLYAGQGQETMDITRDAFEDDVLNEDMFLNLFSQN